MFWEGFVSIVPSILLLPLDYSPAYLFVLIRRASLKLANLSSRYLISLCSCENVAQTSQSVGVSESSPFDGQ